MKCIFVEVSGRNREEYVYYTLPKKWSIKETLKQNYVEYFLKIFTVFSLHIYNRKGKLMTY